MERKVVMLLKKKSDYNKDISCELFVEVDYQNPAEPFQQIQ